MQALPREGLFFESNFNKLITSVRLSFTAPNDDCINFT